MAGQHRRSVVNPVVRRVLMMVWVPLSLVVAMAVGVMAGTLLGVYAPGSLPLPN
ncbi:hypothetical protein VMT65_07120 [Nocardia sp. CDC153]|uniref:hypothetical protein n=1 Tax=Nocardia sp. CDC153 TaxID=3112167 RepID=UPI002DBA7BBD|nr:hypothetical protein [Nocardia sp. CDC153]MEC3952796.1 hypothetical protein [Nocardia sp. CDC153]